MAEVYRKAEEVIAWVCLEDSEDPRVMKQVEIERALRGLQALEKE